MVKYWVQEMAPAGNWFDSLGTNSRASALSYAKGRIILGYEARVIIRHDTTRFSAAELRVIVRSERESA